MNVLPKRTAQMSFRRVSAVFRDEKFVKDIQSSSASPAGKGLLFAHQETLPKLPVPSLEETRTLFLESIKPFDLFISFTGLGQEKRSSKQLDC
jgi:hypothetical protein